MKIRHRGRRRDQVASYAWFGPERNGSSWLLLRAGGRIGGDYGRVLVKRWQGKRLVVCRLFMYSLSGMVDRTERSVELSNKRAYIEAFMAGQPLPG